MRTFRFMEYCFHFSRFRVQGSDRGWPTSTFPYIEVFLYKVKDFGVQKIVVFRFILSFLIAAFTWRLLCYKQSPVFTLRFQKKFSFLQLHLRKKLFVKTTARSIMKTRRVFHPFVNVTLYYVEELRNCDINWIHFVSPKNTRKNVQSKDYLTSELTK